MDWSQENGWTAFYTFAQSDTYDDAWEAGAKAFGPQTVPLHKTMWEKEKSIKNWKLQEKFQ